MSVDEVRITLPLPAGLLREVDEARRGTARTAWIRGAMEARLRAEARPAEPDLFVTAGLVAEAKASIALDGETQSLPTEAEVAAARAPERHLHRFKPTGRVLRYERGIPVNERQCDCGVIAPD